MTRQPFSKPWLTALAVVAAVALIAPPTWADEAKTTFSIPSQDLSAALREFARQSNREILFSSEVAKGKTTKGVNGDLTADAALTKLLAGTGLVVVKSADGATLVTSPDAKEASGNSGTPSAPSGAGSSHSSTSPGSGPQKTDSLEEITVTGRYEFLSVDTSGATNLPLPIEKVPQSISLVSNDFIRAADLKTLGEIAEYTPGAINVGNPENTGSIIELRGFAAGRAIDGINVIQSNSLYEPDFAIFDRLEVVKGPSSVVYGVSSPGGVVNFVTKSATTQTIDYLYAQAGNWNNYRAEGQVAGAVDTSGRIRAIGVAVYEQGDSFLDQLYHKKTSLYGGINIDLSDSLTGYLHGGYERFVRPSFDGIPTEADGSPAPLPRSFFIGSKDIVITSNVYHAEGDLTWHATDMLEFSIKGNYQRANTFGSEDYSFGLQQNGDISLEAHRFTDLAKNYGLGISSIYRFDALGLKNSFVSLAALYQASREPIVAQFGVNGADFGAGNIFSGDATLSQTLVSLLAVPVAPYELDSDASTFTISAQSVLQLIDPLSLLLGISYSKPELTVTTNGMAQNLNARGRTSYRAGLTYEFLPRTNAYVSLSQSFNLQPNIAAGGAPLPPLTGNQYEVGLKYRTVSERLLLTGALFQIDEKNLGEFFEQVGSFLFYKPADVRHRGLEFQALGQITPQWQVNAGYAYLDPKIIQGLDPNTLKPISDRTEVFQPKQTMSVYTTYALQDGILRGLSFGGGPRYVSDQRTAYDGSTKEIAGYTLVDATASYAIKDWLVQLNGHNILNRRYFINNYQTLFFGNIIGEPFNVSLSVRRKFSVQPHLMYASSH